MASPRTNVPPGSLLDDRTRVTFYFQWQALRRHAEYRRAVPACLQEIKAFTAGVLAQLDALDQPSAPPEAVEYAALLSAARVLATQHSTGQGWLRELAALTDTLHREVFPFERRKAVPSKHRDLYYATYRRLVYLCSRQTQALLAPLAQFAQEWGIRLPMDPAIAFLPDFVALHVWDTAYAIEVIYPPGNDEIIFSFRVRPGATKDAVLALVDDVLQTHVPPAWMGKSHRRRHNRAYYAALFETYDRRMNGESPRQIAQALWPEELAAGPQPYPDSPHQHPAVQRVRDLVRAAKKLIANTHRTP